MRVREEGREGKNREKGGREPGDKRLMGRERREWDAEERERHIGKEGEKYTKQD